MYVSLALEMVAELFGEFPADVIWPAQRGRPGVLHADDEIGRPNQALCGRISLGRVSARRKPVGQDVGIRGHDGVTDFHGSDPDVIGGPDKMEYGNPGRKQQRPCLVGSRHARPLRTTTRSSTES